MRGSAVDILEKCKPAEKLTNDKTSAKRQKEIFVLIPTSSWIYSKKNRAVALFNLIIKN